MVTLIEKQLKEWKAALAKDGVVYDSDDDYKEAMSNLVGYFDMLIQMDLQQKQDKN